MYLSLDSHVLCHLEHFQLQAANSGLNKEGGIFLTKHEAYFGPGCPDLLSVSSVLPLLHSSFACVFIDELDKLCL